MLATVRAEPNRGLPPHLWTPLWIIVKCLQSVLFFRALAVNKS